jgi:hypothetical protein
MKAVIDIKIKVKTPSDPLSKTMGERHILWSFGHKRTKIGVNRLLKRS